MRLEIKAVCTGYAVRSGYLSAKGTQVPESYVLQFVAIETRDNVKMVVRELPEWIKEIEEDNLIKGTLQVDFTVDPYLSKGVNEVYRALYVGFADREPVSLE